MDCYELEDRLEALLDGELTDAERRRCARHLEKCRRCRELVEPLAVAAEPPADLVGSVLARTSGATCGRAHALLCDLEDGALTATERELVGRHLESCGDCRALAAVLARLSVDLPRLAELAPDRRFVEDVLSATLPYPVLLRRWWSRTWPQWLRRPRFASEAAFVATMVLVLVFATPDSPLEALPAKALELTRIDPLARLKQPLVPLEDRFATRVEAPLRSRWDQGEAAVRGWAEEAVTRGRALSNELIARIGTFWEAVASLFESADREPSTAEAPASNT
ncbi:MAG: zf-HC2 domain-containing protein [Alphaproteobacteria bacterium]